MTMARLFGVFNALLVTDISINQLASSKLILLIMSATWV